jgi:hypothetical protein
MLPASMSGAPSPFCLYRGASILRAIAWNPVSGRFTHAEEPAGFTTLREKEEASRVLTVLTSGMRS